MSQVLELNYVWTVGTTTLSSDIWVWSISTFCPFISTTRVKLHHIMAKHCINPRNMYLGNSFKTTRLKFKIGSLVRNDGCNLLNKNYQMGTIITFAKTKHQCMKEYSQTHNNSSSWNKWNNNRDGVFLISISFYNFISPFSTYF